MLFRSNIASQWASTGETDAALAWARALPAGEGRTNALGSVFERWAAEAPEEAVRQALALPAEDRQRALPNAARGWANQDPAAVIRWATSIPEENVRNEIRDNALGVWANRAPQEAAGWVAGLPAADRERPLTQLIDRWASSDIEAAAEWLNRQPADRVRDGAVANLAGRLVQEDPEAAVAWAAAITDDGRRRNKTEEIVRNWMRFDPQGARAWVSGSWLPQESRDRLLQLRPR